MTAPDWRLHAACRGMNPELFHPGRGDNQAVIAAKAVCAHCPVRQPCLTDALAHPELSQGVWGGLSQRERDHLRGRRPARLAPVRYRTRTCPWCARQFQPTNAQNIHCSTSCAQRARRARNRNAS